MTGKIDPDDTLRTEWVRLADDTHAPALSDLRERAARRSSRRNSTMAGTGAAVLAVGALGVTLSGGLGVGGAVQTESSTAAGQTASDDATHPRDATRPRQENSMDFGLDESRPGMSPSPNPSLLDRLRAAEDQRNVPFPQTMPQNVPGRPLASATAVAAFADRAEQIFVFSGEGLQMAPSSPSSHANIRDVREWLKSPATTAEGSSVSLALTGSQTPVGGSGLYLAFVAEGRSLALYSINGAHAQQVSPAKVSAPGTIKLDDLRAALPTG